MVSNKYEELTNIFMSIEKARRNGKSGKPEERALMDFISGKRITYAEKRRRDRKKVRPNTYKRNVFGD